MPSVAFWAAVAIVAADMRSGETAHVAQELDEQTAWFNLAFSQRSIDADLEGHVHGCSLRTGGVRMFLLRSHDRNQL
jgi:hypothetical protein